MPDAAPEPVDRDSRGILDPWLLRQRVRLTRYPPTPVLDGLVDRFWAVRWDLPAGLVHRQQILTHPGGNLSIGSADGRPGDREARPPEARLNGVARRLTTRTLVGQGWAVAAMTRPGGLGALVSGSAADWTGAKTSRAPCRTVPMAPLPPPRKSRVMTVTDVRTSKTRKKR